MSKSIRVSSNNFKGLTTLPKYLIISLLAIIVLTSCKTTKNVTIEGNLYFQMVDFFNFNNATDSIFEKIETQVVKMNIDTVPENDRKFYEIIKYAIDQDVFRLPYIRLQTETNEKLMLYMNRDVYEHFVSLKCSDLKKQGKQIQISAVAKDISYQDIKAYRLVKLKRFERIDGQTDCRK